MIQPNARLGSSGKLKTRKTRTMASGYDPMPPFVAAILKLAAIKAIRTAANGMFEVPSRENEVT